MDKRNAGVLRVRVNARYEQGFREDRKELFWNAVRQSATISVDASGNELEARLVRNFGRELKQKLIDYLHESWSGRGHRHDFPGLSLQAAPAPIADQLLALSSVFFEARVDRYGSLSFDVEIAGARELASLFNNNIELLMMFMRAYVPGTFENAIRFNMPDEALDFEMTASDQLREAFVAPAKSKRAIGLPGASREVGNRKRDSLACRSSRVDRLLRRVQRHR